MVENADGDAWELYYEDGNRYRITGHDMGSGGTAYRVDSFKDRVDNEFSLEYSGLPGEWKLDRVVSPTGRYLELDWESHNVTTSASVELGNPAAVAGWQDITVPSQESFRSFVIEQAALAEGAMRVAEIEVYDKNDNLLTGSAIGSSPEITDEVEYGLGNAFDGDVSTEYRHAHFSGHGLSYKAFIGLNFANGESHQIGRVRIYLKSNALPSFAGNPVLKGYKGASVVVDVIGQVATDDGRSVEYEYSEIADEYLGLSYLALTAADYSDGTSALYSYGSPNTSARPLLETAADPRGTGEAISIRYKYFKTGAYGGLVLEKDGVTGELYAQVGSTSAHKPTVTTADGAMIKQEYYKGLLVQSRDPYGNQTFYTYDQDGLGMLASEEDPLGRKTSYTRDAHGNALTTTLPGGRVITRTYDPEGRILTEEITPAGGGDSRLTVWTRDAFGRVLNKRYPKDGYEEFWTYDGLGNVLTHTLPGGAQESFEYDFLGRRISHTNAVGATTSYTYNGAGLLETETSPLGRVTSYLYNERGQRVQKTRETDGSFKTWAYDDFGRMFEATDYAGARTTWTHDNLKRRLSETRADGTGYAETTTWSYGIGDGGGCGGCNTTSKPTLITYPTGRQVKREYDLMWRLVAETDGFGSAIPATTVHKYDVASQLVKTTDALGHQTTYAYTSTGRRKTMTDALGQDTTWTYTGFDEVETVTAPGGGVTAYQYDELGRQARITDPEGNVTKIWRWFKASGAKIVTGVNDPLGRLTRTFRDPARPGLQDQVGRRYGGCHRIQCRRRSDLADRPARHGEHLQSHLGRQRPAHRDHRPDQPHHDPLPRCPRAHHRHRLPVRQAG